MPAHAKRTTKSPTAKQIIKKLNLKPLPNEGGYYRQTYKSKTKFPAKLFGIAADSTTRRHLSTAIYFLITPESFSALHRLKSDEVFHFYAGDPVNMIQITNSGALSQFVLGPDIFNNQSPQLVVPKGTWQALKLKPGGQWSLLGTTVAPGFTFTDFELADRTHLLRQFPNLAHHIRAYTRP
jgi:uncharacterized protein